MLCGDVAVVQASAMDGLSFDPFSFQEDGLAAPEVDVGRCQVGDALVVSQMVVVGDEVADLGLELARQIVVLEQDAVLQRLMPSLDLALGHRMIWGAADVLHLPVVEPIGEACREVARAIVREQSGPVKDTGGVDPDACSASSRVSVTSSA